MWICSPITGRDNLKVLSNGAHNRPRIHSELEMAEWIRVQSFVLHSHMSKEGKGGRIGRWWPRELILGVTRKSTLSIWESAWKGWVNWNLWRNKDPILPTIRRIFELRSMTEINKVHRTINFFRSMFSFILEQIDGMEIDKHPLVFRLRIWIYRTTLPATKYSFFLKVSLVVYYFQTLGQN